MDDDYKMMHLGIKKGDIGRYVFLPGSVERATLISEYFDHPGKSHITMNFDYRGH
jgi:uridine phosphorylase